MSAGPETDHHHLLDLGADAVVKEGVDARTLKSHIVAIVRRVQPIAPTLRCLEADGLRLDVWARKATIGGASISLSPMEFDLLQLLMSRPEISVPHHEIVRKVWGWTHIGDRNALRLQVNRLRRKLNDTDSPPRFIRSVRGIGYMFCEPVSQLADDAVAPLGPRAETSPLLHSGLRRLNDVILASSTRQEACDALVRAVVGEGFADASAVLAWRPGLDCLQLLSEQGNTPEWIETVSLGVPLTGAYLAAATVRSGRVHHLVDVIESASRFRGSAQLLRPAQLSSHLSVPLGSGPMVWGHIGFGRRGDSPFTAIHCAVLESAAHLLGAAFAHDGVPDADVRIVG